MAVVLIAFVIVFAIVALIPFWVWVVLAIGVSVAVYLKYMKVPRP